MAHYRDVEKMLDDKILRERMVKWALEFVRDDPTETKTEYEVIQDACKCVCTIWRQTLFPLVREKLEERRKAAAD